MKRDMSQLYSRLGLRPGCTLAEFKHAYLHRIAELHPDHSSRGGVDASALSELVWLYATASRFHRRHGRLPGAPFTHATAHQADDADAERRRISTQPADVDTGVHSTAPKGRSEPSLHAATLALPLAAVLLLVLLSGDWLTPAPRNSPNETPSTTIRPSNAWLVAGMFEAAVLQVQGEPSQKKGDRWMYGPSWVQFDEGRVVDWYSAPQHPLKTETSIPAPRAVKGADHPSW